MGLNEAQNCRKRNFDSGATWWLTKGYAEEGIRHRKWSPEGTSRSRRGSKDMGPGNPLMIHRNQNYSECQRADGQKSDKIEDEGLALGFFAKFRNTFNTRW